MRERGLKCLHRLIKLQASAVAPVRERGLKCRRIVDGGILALSRSREGAWIEIYSYTRQAFINDGRSREGAWIEMLISYRCSMASRSLP